MLVECKIRRENDIKELDNLIFIVENTISYNRVFISNKEKNECKDSLLIFNEQLNNIALQDSLITILYGESPDMKLRISHAKEAVTSQLKRINRLNDYLDGSIKIDFRQQVDNINIHNFYTPKLSTLNLIFSCRGVTDSVVAVQVNIIRGDTILYAQQYKYNRVNSITVPNIVEKKEIIELGYIIKQNNKFIFNYINYGQ